MKNFLLLIFLLSFISFKTYSQCTISVSKTDATCNGGTNGTATVNVSGTTAVNYCVTPPTTNYSCTTGCTSTVSTNASDITINSGQQICLTYNGFTKGISMNGGTLIICAGATPSYLTFNGGTIVVNGTATFNNGLNLNSSGCNLINYGTISVSSGMNVNGSLNNHGTISINSGDLNHQNAGGIIYNTNSITVSPGNFNNSHSFINKGTMTIGGTWYNNSGSNTTNDCTINATTLSNSGPISNKGKINLTNLTFNGNLVTAEPGSQIICSAFTFNSGTLTGAGNSCSLLKVNGNGTLNGGVSITGLISLWITGTTNNYSGQNFSQLNSNCNVNAPVCTYSWSNGATTKTVNNLAAGTYTVTTTCSNSGCSAQTNTVTIGQPAAMVINGTVSPVTCPGGNNGSIAVTVSGGTSPYTYSWSNAVTTQNRTGLTAGTYTLTVTDATNCTKTQSFAITQPAAMVITPQIQNASCNSEPNGSIFVNVTGGTSPYTYSWNIGATTQNLENLGSGSYTVTVTDANACTGTSTSSITQPTALDLSFTVSDVYCYGESNGSATVNVYGGGSVTSSCAIPETPAASVSSGCTQTVSSNTTITVNNGDKVCLTASSFTSAITMNGGTLVILGNAMPSSLNYNGGAVIVTGLATFSAFYMNSGSSVLTNYGTLTFPNGLSFNGTIHNHGILTVTNGDLNTNSATGILNNSNQVKVLNGNFNNNTTATNGGLLSISGTMNNNSAASFTNNCSFNSLAINNNNILINNGSISVSGAVTLNSNSTLTMQSSKELTAGSLMVNGLIHGAGSACSSIKISGTTVVNGPGNITGLVSVCTQGSTTNNSTNSGNVTQRSNCNCTINQGNYSYSWSTGSFEKTISNLPAGKYLVTVLDIDNSCSATDSVLIQQPVEFKATAIASHASSQGATDGSIALTVNGGIPSYSFKWYNLDEQQIATTQNLMNKGKGIYSVTISDSRNCLITTSAEIEENSVVPPDTTAPEAEVFFQVKMDGVVEKFKLGGNIGMGHYGIQAKQGSTVYETEGAKWFVTDSTSDKYLAIEVLKSFNAVPSAMERDSIFFVKSYPYGNSAVKTEGVEIIYYDGQTRWTTRGEQTGSFFEITNSTYPERIDNTYLIQGNFACILYDEAGNSIQLSDGLFSILTGGL